jgi:hypothetical protein
VAAAVAGLLVLVVQSSALAAQPISASELADILSERSPLTADERLEAAQEVLRDERSRRVRDVTGAALNAGWSVWQGGSPRRVAKSAVRLANRMWKFRSRSRAEDEALELLETAVMSGDLNPDLHELYAELRHREQRERRDAQIEDAERALRSGALGLARIRARRTLELDPSSERAAELLAELDMPTPRGAPAVPGEIQEWEARLSAALLAGDFERALANEPRAADAQLAQAVARYLRGDQAEALLALDELKERDDAVGAVALRWYERRDLNAELAFSRAQRAYRTKRTLGVLGGEELATQGFGLSRDSVDSWRDSAELTNVALSIPLRIARRWHPDRSELRGAARQYLDDLPEGDKADAAADWLLALGMTDAPEVGWDDGRFVLPRAQTPYRALAPRALVVTRAVLDSEALGDADWARELLSAAPALRLVAERGAQNSGLAPERARAVLADLALALEQRSVQAHEGSRDEALGAIRRLDAAVREGAALVAQGWFPEGTSLRDSLEDTVLDGHARDATLRYKRKDESILVGTGFGRARFRCPDDAVCVDRESLFRGALYGNLDLGADFKIGARTGFARASLALEVGRYGPQASIVLPVGHWLHVDGWIPVEARFSFGLEGISFKPSFD